MNLYDDTFLAGEAYTRDKASQLFGAFKAGDVTAFSKLYDTYVHVLFNYGSRLTADRDLLKDCIHDVFVKFYTKRDELKSVENFRSYLFISLKNKLCDEMRRGAFSVGTEVGELDVQASEDVEADYVTAEHEEWNVKKVDHLLSFLSPRQREAITLYYIEERKYEEICEIMQMNYQSVRNLMHRGLNKLKSIAC